MKSETGLIDAIKNSEGPVYETDKELPPDFWDYAFAGKPAVKPLVYLSLSFFSSMDDEQFKTFMARDHIVPLVSSNCLKYIYKRCDELNIKIEKNEEPLKYGVKGDATFNNHGGI